MDAEFVMIHSAATSQVAVHAAADVGVRESGALRFSDPSLGRTGVVARVGAEAAPLGVLDVGLEGLLSVGNLADDPVSPTVAGWARVAGDVREGLQLGGQLGVHREFGGTIALTGAGIVAGEAGIFHAGGNVVLERRFDPAADAVDLMVPLELGVDLSPALTVGVAYVGQDLEDYLEDEEEEAEGGASHVACVTGLVHVGKVDVVAAPGVGIGPGGAGFVGRLGVSVGLR